MSAVASGDKSAFGSSMQGKGHSKQPSVRSTDDDAGSPKYGAHGDETEDSDSEYAIGFSQEEWNAQVLGRSALPTGLERSLTAQILHTYETRLFPSAQSIEVKRSFIEKFATILTTEFPDWEVDIHVFGSSVNGLGTSRSDVDICLTTSHKELENVFVLSKALRKYGMRTYCVPHARVPIVKSWDPELRIASDINVNNTIALHNTRMIQTFVAIDARVRPFVMAIKHWSKCRELNDAAFGGTLSPYAWVNLAVNFLQTRTPPILPVIHPPASSLSAVECMRGGELDLTFNDDIDQLRGFGIPNTESLGYLLYAFFRTYAFEFDFLRIRFARHGLRNRPMFHIVAMNARSKRDGKPLEKLGTFNPHPNVDEKAKHISLDFARTKYWLGVGAQPTDGVRFLLERAGLLPPRPLYPNVRRSVEAVSQSI
ncbi:hypothetical protein GGI04_003090 [Coemansia thaxteri]|nr:hypothetical protein GGI04_003090 [Coemansia thaxteri]